MRSCVRFVAGLVAAFTVVLIHQTPAWAQSAQPAPPAQSVAEPNTLTLTPFLSSTFDTSEALGSSLGIGVAVGYDLTRNLGIEGEIAHAFDVVGDDDNLDWPVTNYSVNGIYHFDVSRFTPYATFGLGIEHVSRSVKNPDPVILYPASSTEVAYNFGGGVKYPLSERFLVRGDLRRFQSTDLSPNYWRLYGGVTFWVKR
jgi:opacity protein-like surface antigen